jgi:phage terminase large subunit
MPARSRAERYSSRAAVARLGLVAGISQIKNAGRRSATAFDARICEQRIIQDCSRIPHQLEFVTDFRHRFLALCGGYGSGKTHAAVAKTILLTFRSPRRIHLFLEPTIPLLRDVAIPAWEELLETYEIPHKFKSSPLPNYVLKLDTGDTAVFLRSIENYERMIGINAASIMVDEIDTIKTEIAEKAVVKLQGRVRVGNCPQINFATTPEGHKFLYNFFEKQSVP